MAAMSMAPRAETTLEERITQTLFALAAIQSVSGNERHIRTYIARRLKSWRIIATPDDAGNLLARIPAGSAEQDAGQPLILCAHMDRVPPGLAHTPVWEHGILSSDGTTNLGADDSAGIALILHIVEELRARRLNHPPLLLLFTVGEEIGLVGAKAFDSTPWGVREGIVFDNVGDPGQVVTEAATYVAFDVKLHGNGGHPGKDLDGTASAIEMFHNARYYSGELDHGASRISIGRIEGGTARNAIADKVAAQGEVRTLLAGAARAALLGRIEEAFQEAAKAAGGSVDVVFDPHCDGYQVDADEPLLRNWAAACRRSGSPFHPVTSFIGSDASALRRHSRVFTVSTGAMDEHTTREWIATRPLAEIAETAVLLLSDI